MIEKGQMGRVAVIRLRPNQDLCDGIIEACKKADFKHAIVKSAVGSLNNATLITAKGEMLHEGIGIEILSLNGQLSQADDGETEIMLSGIISRPDQQVFGGSFAKGRNIVCITVELVLQEWMPIN